MATLTPEELGLQYDPNFEADPTRLGGTYGGYIGQSTAPPPPVADAGGGFGGFSTPEQRAAVRAAMAGRGASAAGALGLGTGRGTIISTGGGGGGMAGGLVGADPRDYNPASGGVPGTTNPIDTILGNMGGITGIQTGLTDNALQLVRNMYGPEYFATLGQLQRNVDRRAHGDISDLLPEMWQRNAEAAVGGGYSGSAMENTKRLRDMGLTRYQVENEALAGQGKIFGMTPTVTPQDVSGVIGALVQAQRDADIYRSAPSPEAAYQRALRNVGGGGGGGGGVPGVIPGRLAGGAGASKVDDILKRMGGNVFGPPIIARGTGASTPYSGPAPYGSIDYGDSADSYVGGGFEQPPLQDFGGSLGYGGGAPWTGFAPDIGFGGSLDYAGGAPWTGTSGGALGGTIFDAFNTDWMGDYGAGAPPMLAGGGGWEVDPNSIPYGGGYGYDDYFPYGVEGF